MLAMQADVHSKEGGLVFLEGECRSAAILNKRLEMTAIHKSGRIFPVELTVTRTRVQGEPLFTGFLRDITERKRVELQRIDAIRARDELVAVVSHELKNPLTAVSTGIELIRRSRDRDPDGILLDKQLSSMKASIQRMARLTSDLLDVTKIESGHLKIETADCDLAAMLHDALSVLEPLAIEKKIRLVRNFPKQGIRAPCDRERVSQVIANVAGNAIKFTAEGGAVEVAARDEGEEILIEVRDTGPGISAEQLTHAIDRFWQAKETAYKGTGLGLSIAKGIVEAHGGKIWAESEVGRGSNFFFRLPKRSNVVVAS